MSCSSICSMHLQKDAYNKEKDERRERFMDGMNNGTCNYNELTECNRINNSTHSELEYRCGCPDLESTGASENSEFDKVEVEKGEGLKCRYKVNRRLLFLEC